MKGEDNFFLRISSLNDICLYSKQKKAWIHRRKVLDSLCFRSCIVPFPNFTIIAKDKIEIDGFKQFMDMR